MNDVLAVYKGDSSGNVLQHAEDDAEVRLLGCLIMIQAGCQTIRKSDVTKFLKENDFGRTF